MYFVHAVWGPWVLYTLEGKMIPLRLRLGFHFPLGCTKRHGSRHSVQQLCTVITYCEVLLFENLSRDVIQPRMLQINWYTLP